MELRIFVEPQQGATYDELLRIAQATEDLGFDAFFRSDHYQKMGSTDGLPGPTDAWITLAGLARETSRIRLGSLMNSATFRLPGPLAVMVAQVDAMSGGRIELGLGAGWFPREHTSYGIPFPPVGERFDRLAEQLAVISGLWSTPDGERFSYDGKHYQLLDAPALPKPVQRPGPPIIVGGKGPRRTPELAARFADEFNMPFKTVDQTANAFERVKVACQTYGRPAGKTLTLSAGVVVALGRTDAEAHRRAAPLHVPSALPPEDPVVGTPGKLVERIGELAAVGATRVHLRVIDLSDLDHVDLIAAEVLPQVTA
jgi:F420-dependent oxidoreductase-like protein